MSGKPTTILEPTRGLDLLIIFNIFSFFFLQKNFIAYCTFGEKSKRPLLKSFDKTKKDHFAK